jgi:uncharacterized protein YijF (DUF1287 family)
MGTLPMLSGCDPSSQQQNKIVERELPIPPMTSVYGELPDVTTMRDDWFYPPNETEDPYSPEEEVLSLPIQPEIELTFAEELAQAALARTMHRVRYDGRYLKIAYPMGDVPDDIGVCTDVVIRSYRELGIDLQKDVHEDIRRNFSKYPSKKRWGLRRPDTNIDHRRVYNLQAFFERKGESIPITDDPRDYQPGDLVTWQVGPKLPHIGIVLDMVSNDEPSRHLIAHNIGAGPVIDDILFRYRITGHYRYQPKLKPKQKNHKSKVIKG